jgi:hypothetical protein
MWDYWGLNGWNVTFSLELEERGLTGNNVIFSLLLV